MTTSEKCLMKFFHKQNSKTSNGCNFPVVPAGIVNKTISFAESGFFKLYPDNDQSTNLTVKLNLVQQLENILPLPKFQND